MGRQYMNVLKKDENILHYQRAPNIGSVFSFIFVLAVTFLISLSAEHWLLRTIISLVGLYIGYVATEKYEECIFDKKSDKVSLCNSRILEKMLFGYRKMMVNQLSAVEDVRVFTQPSKRGRHTHNVEIVFKSGLTIAMTTCLTYDPKSCHEKVVEEVKEFLEISNSTNLADLVELKLIEDKSIEDKKKD